MAAVALRLGVNVIQEPLPRLRAWWRTPTAAAFDWLGLPDSPVLSRDTFVTSALAAAECRFPRLGPMVTNPVTRHPSVTASALLSLDELAPNRVAVVLGAGNMAVYGINGRGASVEALRNYLAALRESLDGREATWAGRPFRLHQPEPAARGRVAMFLAAHGPRSLAMAAATADGVLSGFGLRPENVARVHEIVDGAAGHRAAPAGIEVWWHAPVVFAASREAAFAELSGAGAPFLARHGFDGKDVPRALRAGIAAVAEEAARPASHGARNEVLVQIGRRSGVLDYLVERQGGLAGPVEDVVEGLRRLIALGVDRLVILPLGRDRLETADAFLEAVVAAGRAARQPSQPSPS